MLRSLGVDPAKVLRRAGVDARLFDDANHRISFATRSHLIAHCVATTGCPHFGLLIGQQGGLDSLGIVGLLARSSANVEAALRSVVRHFYLHARGAVTHLMVEGDSASLCYDIYESRAEATDQVADAAVAVSFNVLRGLCGPKWMPMEIRLAHRRPEDLEPFRRFFRAPLRFNAGHNAVVFPAAWLKHPLPDTSPELRRILQRQIETLAAHHVDDFPEQVRSVLRGVLITDQCTADQVAALFSINRRTLTRRLNAFGTGFRELVDETRFEIARQMLEDSAMPVSEIAAMLDYAGANAFTRAFRRWSNATPGQWRARIKASA